MTLIEVLVAMVISLIVSAAMVAVMANTLGTGTRTIAMTHLTQQLRTAMQIMSRDLRRANYIRPEDSRKCIRNANCLTNLGYSGQIGQVEIGDAADCLSFWLDRDSDGTLAATDRGGFRLVETSGIGRIEMLVNSTGMAANNCPSGDWVPITDPDTIDVQSFVVDNSASYVLTITTGGATQRVQKIGLELNAELLARGNVSYTISRTIGDEIRVRNDFTTP